MTTVIVRLTFTSEVTATSVIEHLYEPFNDDGSLVEATELPLDDPRLQRGDHPRPLTRNGEASAVTQ